MAAASKARWFCDRELRRCHAFSAACRLEPRSTPSTRVEVTGHYDNSVGSSDAASAGVDHAAADRGPAAAAPGQPARVRARHGRHAAQRRRQGQPVLPARLQPRPRHRLRHLGGRHAGQPAHARPRPGLHRPQLHHSRADLARRLLEGAVLRERSATSARPAARTMHYIDSAEAGHRARHAAATSATRARCSPARPRAGPASLTYGLEYLHNDGPWEVPDDFRKCNAAAALRDAGGRRQARRDRDGLQRQLELDRPGRRCAPSTTA